MLAAEKHCGHLTQSTPWFPALKHAGLKVRYWNFRKLQNQIGVDRSCSLAIIASKTDIKDDNCNDIISITHQLKTARAALTKLRKNAPTHRKAHLTELAKQEALCRHKWDVEHTIKRIQSAENQSRIFQKLQFTLERRQQKGLHQLIVPQEACKDDGFDPIDGVDTYPPTSTSSNWITLNDRSLVEAHLVARNNAHYRQANHTPFACTNQGNNIGFHGTNSESNHILEGTYSFDLNSLSPESLAYIQALKHPFYHMPPDSRPAIDTNIDEKALAEGISKWREKTSTSPSGLHLGHYRTFLYRRNDDKDEDDKDNYSFFQVMAHMLNIPLHTGQPPNRWLTASSVCLEKETNNPRTDKLCIIHLFEADLNLVWKLLWGNRLVRLAESNDTFPDAQYGSRPSRSSIDGVLCKLMMNKFSRVARINFAIMDNDATANYDRIVCALSSIACQRLGMPSTAELLHNNTLLNMRYNVKTAYGTSNATYGATPDNPMQGQGQGSGNAPSCWGAISAPMWTALRQICQHQFRCFSTDGKLNLSTQGVAFVDDAANVLNDAEQTHPLDEPTLVSNLQSMAQAWERLLFTTGGALKLPKCFCYIVIWDWANGFPILCSKNKFKHFVTIHDSNTNEDITITLKDPNSAERTLGVRIAPSGSQKAEFQWLLQKANNFARLITKGRLSREEARYAYLTIFIPSMSYSLGVTSFTPPGSNKNSNKSFEFLSFSSRY